MSSNYISLFNETNGNFNNIIVDGTVDLSDAIVIVGTISFADGTLSAPSITFISDNTTGIWKSDIDEVSISGGGNLVITFNPTYIASRSRFLAPSGTLSSPGYSFNSNTSAGMYYSGLNVISFATPSHVLDLTNAYVNPRVPLLCTAGSGAAPSIIFSGSDTGTGIFHNSVQQVNIAINGNEMFRVGNTQIQMYEALAMGSNTISCGNIMTTGITWTGSNINSAVYLDGTNNLRSTTLNDGQLLIGRTGNVPTSATLTGTTNQVIITNGANSITLSLPQSIDTTSIPAFAGMVLNGLLSMSGNNISNIGTAVATSLQCTNFQFTNAKWNSSNTNALIYIDSTNNLVNTASMTNGQILIGNGSGAPALGTLTATANQTTVTNGAGTITIGTVQNINTTSTPTFAGAYLNGTTVIGNTSAISTGMNKLQLYGTDSSTSGPHVEVFTSADTTYPIFQQYNWAHNNMGLLFDCYNDGTNTKSSSSGSNFQILKNNNYLKVITTNGITAGSNISSPYTALTIGSGGQVLIGNTTPIAGTIAMFELYGADSSSSGPHMGVWTSADTTYPVFQQLNYAHNTVALNFDSYWNGSWKSSHSGSNYQIYKFGNQLQFNYNTGTTAGAGITWTSAGYFDTSGNFNLNTAKTLNCGAIVCTTVTPTKYNLMVQNTGTQTITNNTLTNVVFQSLYGTIQNNITFTASTSQTSFTIPITGWYSIFAQTSFPNNSDTTRRLITIYNSTVGVYFGSKEVAAINGDATRISTMISAHFAVNDAIQVVVLQQGGVSLNIGGDSYSPTYLTINFINP